MKILFWPELSKDVKEIGEALCPDGMELDWVSGDAGEEEMLEHLAGAECFFTQALRPLSPAVYPELGRLKLVQLLSAGYDFLDIDLVRANGLVVCRNGGANAISVAEHAMMLILSVLRRLTELEAGMRAGDDLRDPTRNHELAGRTVGLFGFGFIGRQMAQRLRGFEVEVLYHDIVRADPETEAALDVSFCTREELFARSDVLSLHTPLNEGTQHVVNRETLATMKPDAVLINTARGELVDEDALAEALRAGSLMGAGLDVFALEPTPKGYPLLDPTLGIVTTPHSAGPTWESYPRRFRQAFSNAERVRRGEAPLWLIPELL